MNRTTIVVGAIILAAASATLSGCDLGDILQVQTPSGIQQDTGLPGSMSLNEAEQEYRLELERQKTHMLAWRDNIEGSNTVRGIISQLALQQLNDLGPMVGGVPVVGPLLLGALPIAGLFVRRPGDKSGTEVEQLTRAEHASTWDEARRTLLDELRQAGALSGGKAAG
jgi:hypothetical protein